MLIKKLIESWKCDIKVTVVLIIAGALGSTPYLKKTWETEMDEELKLSRQLHSWDQLEYLEES